jgi:NAD(P)H-dependent FMN reductase
MSAPVRIFGIAGSLRKGSHNRATLRAAAALLPAGASLDAYELGDLPGLRQILVSLDVRLLNRPEISDAKRRFDADVDETTRKLLAQLLEALVAWTRTFSKGT